MRSFIKDVEAQHASWPPLLNKGRDVCIVFGFIVDLFANNDAGALRRAEDELVEVVGAADGEDTIQLALDQRRGRRRGEQDRPGRISGCTSGRQRRGRRACGSRRRTWP